jgi:ribulose bisphosphate carboxylase small subunit
MNNQIRLLVEQAGFTVEDGHIQSLSNKQIKKLIELIVRECMDIIDEAVDQREPASTYTTKIEQHFGLEDAEKQIQQRSTYFGHDL